jgi:hypothetical protein
MRPIRSFTPKPTLAEARARRLKKSNATPKPLWRLAFEDLLRAMIEAARRNNRAS